MSIVTEYNTIKNLRAMQIKINELPPVISDADKLAGIITRYFVRRTADDTSEIYEVDKTLYLSLLKSAYYVGIELPWKIRGTNSTTSGLTKDGTAIKLYTSVEETNKNIILQYKKIFPGIENKIIDYKQFWVGY